MKPHVLLVLAVGLLLAADAKEDTKKDAKEDAKKELKKMEGTWQVTSSETDGQKMSEEDVKQIKVIIKGNQYTLKQLDNTINQGTFKLDPTKKPKTIDIMPKEGDNSGGTMKGIYEFKGDTQKICWAPPDHERPTKFTAEGGCTLIVYKKAKP